MSAAEIIPFDFEEQAVRVVMRGDEPWFVAADVCRVLEIGNPTDTIRRLDDDEVTLDTIEGSHRQTNLISESGLYALIFTSRKDQAKRFRKWVTAEVLPSIRKTGRYDFPGLSGQPRPEGEVFGMNLREAELVLSVVREARLTRGPRAAARLWDNSPLPPLTPAGGTFDPDDGRACLAHLLGAAGDPLRAARDGDAVALDDLARKGVRVRDVGLFVANYSLVLFDGTRWADGAHRRPLSALPGVVPAGPWRVGGVSTRGVVLPWALIDGGHADG